MWESFINSPWMAWAQDADVAAPALDALAAITHMPWPLALGLGLWLALRLGEAAAARGISRSLAYWGLGAGVTLIVVLIRSGAQSDELLGAITLGSLREAAQQVWDVALQWIFAFELALGYVLLRTARQLNWNLLWHQRMLALTTVLEFVLTTAAVGSLLVLLGLPVWASIAAAVLAAHSSPVMLGAHALPWQAEGQVSSRAMQMGLINLLLCAASLSLVVAWGLSWQQSSSGGATGVAIIAPWRLQSGWELLLPLLQSALSLCFGLGLGLALARHFSAQPRIAALRANHLPDTSYTQRDKTRSARDTLAMAAALSSAVGCALWLGGAIWLTCLGMGLGLSWRVPAKAFPSHSHSPASSSPASRGLPNAYAITHLPPRWNASLDHVLCTASLMVLCSYSAAFVLLHIFKLHAGEAIQAAAWDGQRWLQILAIVALLLTVRLVIKLGLSVATAQVSGLRWRSGYALGLALQPMSLSGLPLLLMAMPLLDAPAHGAMLIAAVLLLMMLSDLLAPSLLRHVLERSGDLPQSKVFTEANGGEQVDTRFASPSKSLEQARVQKEVQDWMPAGAQNRPQSHVALRPPVLTPVFSG